MIPRPPVPTHTDTRLPYTTPFRSQRQQDRQAERDPYPQIDYEQRVAVEPAMAERLEQADAVIVEPVEHRMAEAAEIGEREQPALVKRRTRHGPRAPQIGRGHV